MFKRHATRHPLVRKAKDQLLYAWQLCLAAQEDYKGKHIDEADSGRSCAFKEAVGSVEILLKGVLSEESQSVEYLNFHQLIEKFKILAGNRFPQSLEIKLRQYKELRNDAEHSAIPPRFKELRGAFEVARELFTNSCGVPIEFESRRQQPVNLHVALSLSEPGKQPVSVLAMKLTQELPPSRQKLFPRRGSSLTSQGLTAGDRVTIEFSKKPSAHYSDPHCRVIGLSDEQGHLIPRSSFRLQRGHSLTQEVSDLPGLCIPTYDVPVEFRELLYVREPLWSSVKKHVVDAVFLEHFLTKPLSAQIIAFRPNPDKPGQIMSFYSCAEYDQVLSREWVGYKALENALSLGSIYKDRSLQVQSYDGLRYFVDEEFIKSGLIRRLLESENAAGLEPRFCELDYVFRVFRGLVNRFRFLNLQPWARRATNARQ